MQYILFNKKIIPATQPCIHYNDRGFTLGHGLFETILINHSLIPAFNYHWRRLEKSAGRIGIALPFTQDELRTMLNDLIIRNNLNARVAGARLTLTHGDSERGILPAHAPEPNFVISVFELKQMDATPYTTMIVQTRKNEHAISALVKSTSYLDNILARQEALSHGYEEAILLNTAGNLADGAITTVYLVKEGQIFTPPITDGALPGVIRAMLIQELDSANPIQERTISPDELLLADEIFLTNALLGVRSVNKINTKTLRSFSMANQISEWLRVKKNYI